MKIDKPVSAPVDFQKMSQQKRTAAPKASDDIQSKLQTRQNDLSQVDQVLSRVVSEIESQGLSAGEVHSDVDETKVNGFLQSMQAESKRPTMSEADLLALADKTAKSQTEDPLAASAAFNPLDPQRIADLV